jgi:AAA domain-containing protein
MPKTSSDGIRKTPPVITGHDRSGSTHTLTYEGGVVIVARHPRYDQAGNLYGEISAYLDGTEINTAYINLLNQHHRVDFQRVAMARDGRVDWQDYLLSAIQPIRAAIDSRTDEFTHTDPIRTPTLVTLSNVTPELVTWLWYPYIPRRKVGVLEGDPGQGKTWIALAITAAVTRGRTPYSGEACPPTDVIYLSAEAGLADTLRPRLDAAGADVTRVHCLTGWMMRSQDDEAPRCGGVTLGDIEILRQALADKRPGLVVIDPLQAYLGSQVDIHRANETRPILAGLATLAEQHNCAILLIRHLSKALQDRAVYRGLGSIDFAAAARSILLAGQDPQAPSRRVLVHVKSSLAPLGLSLGFELREGQFLWTGPSDITAEAMLRPYQPEEERSAVEEAQDFLRQSVAAGEKPANEVLKEAKKAGLSERTIDRAKKGIVKARKAQVAGEPKGSGPWVWYLVEDQGCQEAQQAHRDSVAPFKDTQNGLHNQSVESLFKARQMAPFNSNENGEGLQVVMSGFKGRHPGSVGKERHDGALDRQIEGPSPDVEEGRL